jgi:hypothetical protein
MHINIHNDLSMRKQYIIPVIFLLPVAVMLIMVTSGYKHPATGNAAAIHNSAAGFAVVELFTSEGCSSCPPADEAVAKIVRDYKDNVFVLCFHVDYWNSLGWKDIFSSPDYTARQREYAQTFRLNSIYTPQVVVNGKSQFVGSDESRLKAAIGDELSKAKNSEMSIHAVVKDGKQIAVSWQIPNAGQRSFCVALIQSAATSEVLRGENGGKKLHHVHVVRDFKTIKPGSMPGGIVELTVPAGLTAGDCTVISFLQDKNSLVITAAAATSIK